MLRCHEGKLATAVAVSLGAALLAAGTAAARPAYELAGHCLALRSAANSTPFYFKATGLGTYMLYDPSGQFLSASGGSSVGVAAEAGSAAEWAAERRSRGSFTLRSTSAHKLLAADAAGALSLGGSGHPTRFRLTPASGCRPFPEAEVNASGRPGKDTNRDGTVFGFVDAHLHITADMRAGGRVIHGEAFDRFGIPTALGGDERDHGADGSRDVTGNLLRTGLPFGGHDTHGWPSFSGWPTYDTNTHQQIYYRWLERVWRAGLRLVVAQTVDDEPICRIEPLRRASCDETRSIKAQIRRLRALEDYVDAQSGGPGRGWFRLVRSPRQARRVIRRGKLAVIIGIESSDLFGCDTRKGRPGCTRRDIERGIRRYRRLGVRGVFVAHWTDNALSGAALEGGAKGAFINVFNRIQTGRYFKTSRCPARGQGEEVRRLSTVELQVLSDFFPATRPLVSGGMPDYPPGRQCNTRGLTKLGRYAIRRLMAHHMLIEVDHMSERARDALLAIAARRRYPLVSSHNGTGGTWTSAELTRLYRLGGFAAVNADQAPKLVARLLAMRRFRSRGRLFGVGLGTDTGGFASLPGPRAGAASGPLPYPFRSFDGRVRFERQRTGQRTFDLNSDGVAHYGLIADLLADVQRSSRGRRALPLLFRSAEAYLRTWRRALRHR